MVVRRYAVVAIAINFPLGDKANYALEYRHQKMLPREWDQPLEIRRLDEVGELANSFNQMKPNCNRLCRPKIFK